MRYFLFFLAIPLLNFAQDSGAVLQAKLRMQEDEIPVGKEVQFQVNVQNLGNEKNQEGKIYLEFTFPEELKEKEEYPLFKTEETSLPSIKPGDSYEITFSEAQKLPSIYDFILDAWTYRRYQIMVKFDGKVYKIGEGSVVFTAYYYPGYTQPLPKEVPSMY